MPKRRKVMATSAAPATDRTHSRPIQSLRPGSPRETEAARTVRPRPLHVNEKVGFMMRSAIKTPERQCKARKVLKVQHSLSPSTRQLIVVSKDP